MGTHYRLDREQRRDLAQSAVQGIFREGCRHLGAKPSDLERWKKCAPEKILPARYIKEHFSMANPAISRLLHMGDLSLVGSSRSIVEMDKVLARRYKPLRRDLNAKNTAQITGPFTL